MRRRTVDEPLTLVAAVEEHTQATPGGGGACYLRRRCRSRRAQSVFGSSCVSYINLVLLSLSAVSTSSLYHTSSMDRSMMDCLKLALAVFAALISLAAARTHFPGHFHAALTQENTLSPMGSNSVSERDESMKDWVKISETERTLRVGRGQRLEVDCEAIGSPSPRIQWRRGSRPVTQFMEEDNVVRGFGLAKIVRTYVVDCASPSHEGEYTCTAISGGETAISTPTRVIVDDDMSSECRPGAPKISIWAPIVMQTMGSDVRIPCRVHGMARVSWVSKDGQLVSNAPGSRFRVLESGDLEITKLKWVDMGKYSCYAENQIGKDSVSTFLYPMLSEN